MVLPKYIKLNEYAIKLKDDKQSSYEWIYNLGSVELETLKTYIKTHLKTKFIQPFKSFAGTLILFDKKSNNSFCLWVDYQSLNNLTIKNRYLLPLIGELLDRLGSTKGFTQLNLTNTYHRMRIKEGDK